MATTDIEKKSALGRGLASLIPGAQTSNARPVQKEFFLCDIEKIIPNTYQPRKIFDKDSLSDLVESVRVHGIMQPLVVRIKDGHYELIAGERRWRAAQKVGLSKVPVIVRDAVGDKTSLSLALIENIQRSDLNCIEEAIAYQQLIDEFQLSQEQVAQEVGKNRATVANILRLLKLPAVIREDLTAERLSMGHARSLLSLDSSEQQIQLRDEILKSKLSVRETEKKVQALLKGAASGQEEEGPAKPRSPHLVSLEEKLRRTLGSKVKIFGSEKKGMIQVMYSSAEDLMRLGDLLVKEDNLS